jgi:hypothetical protein
MSKQFYEELQKALDEINKNDYLLIAGDMIGGRAVCL